MMGWLAAEPPTIVVYGGHGFFGWLVVNDLLEKRNGRLAQEQIRPWQQKIGERNPAILAAIAAGAPVRRELTTARCRSLSRWLSYSQLFGDLHRAQFDVVVKTRQRS